MRQLRSVAMLNTAIIPSLARAEDVKIDEIILGDFRRGSKGCGEFRCNDVLPVLE